MARAMAPIRRVRPTEKQKRARQRASRTKEWLKGLRAGELAQYAGCYIAAQDERVVAAAKTSTGLYSALAQIPDREGVVVQHIEAPGVVIYVV